MADPPPHPAKREIAHSAAIFVIALAMILSASCSRLYWSFDVVEEKSDYVLVSRFQSDPTYTVVIATAILMIPVSLILFVWFKFELNNQLPPLLEIWNNNVLQRAEAVEEWLGEHVIWRKICRAICKTAAFVAIGVAIFAISKVAVKGEIMSHIPSREPIAVITNLTNHQVVFQNDVDVKGVLFADFGSIMVVLLYGVLFLCLGRIIPTIRRGCYMMYHLFFAVGVDLSSAYWLETHGLGALCMGIIVLALFIQELTE